MLFRDRRKEVKVMLLKKITTQIVAVARQHDKYLVGTY